MTATEKKKSEWRTAIAEATSDGVQVRGYDVVKDLIGKIDFGAMVYLLLKGELPKGNEGQMINAIFVSVADHGISPSSTVSRPSIWKSSRRTLTRSSSACATPTQASWG